MRIWPSLVSTMPVPAACPEVVWVVMRTMPLLCWAVGFVVEVVAVVEVVLSPEFVVVSPDHEPCVVHGAV